MRLIGAVTVLVVVAIVNGRSRYRLHYDASIWENARTRCLRGGGKLAVPKSENEFKQIQSVVRKMRYSNVQGGSDTTLAWVGVSNLGDFRTWRTVDGEDITLTGFSTWTGASSWNNSEDPREPHCAGVGPAGRGLRVHWCHLKQPYVCEYDVKPSD